MFPGYLRYISLISFHRGSRVLPLVGVFTCTSMRWGCLLKVFKLLTPESHGRFGPRGVAVEDGLFSFLESANQLYVVKKMSYYAEQQH